MIGRLLFAWFRLHCRVSLALVAALQRRPGSRTIRAAILVNRRARRALAAIF